MGDASRRVAAEAFHRQARVLYDLYAAAELRTSEHVPRLVLHAGWQKETHLDGLHRRPPTRVPKDVGEELPQGGYVVVAADKEVIFLGFFSEL